MAKSVAFIDAGYLLSVAGELSLGTSIRGQISFNYQAMIHKLSQRLRDASSTELLRMYWYDASPHGIPTQDQAVISGLSGVRLRLGVLDQGRQKGVDTMISRDILRFANNPRIDTVILVSGDADLVPTLEEAGDLGARVFVQFIAGIGRQKFAYSLMGVADQMGYLEAAFFEGLVRKRGMASLPPGIKHFNQLGFEYGTRWAAENWPLTNELIADLPKLPRDLDAELLSAAVEYFEEADLREGDRRTLRSGFADGIRTFGREQGTLGT